MYGYPMTLDCGCVLTTEYGDCTCCGCPLDIKRDEEAHDNYRECPWFTHVHALGQ